MRTLQSTTLVRTHGAERVNYPGLKAGVSAPIFDEGFSRIGCVVCPFILSSSPGATRQRKESMRRWPGIWKAYEHAVKKWFTAKMVEGLRSDQRHRTPEDYWQAYLRGFE